MTSRSSFLSSIKSIQRGTITITDDSSNTATITAVDTAKSFVSWGGFTSTSSATVIGNNLPKVVLTNSTTVTANSEMTVIATTIISFEVIEFN